MNNNLGDYIGQGLMGFAQNLVQGQQNAQRFALEQKQIDAMNAYRQAQVEQQAFERGRQEKADWLKAYGQGMDELANKYLVDKYTGSPTGDVDPSVIARVDPSKLMAMDELARKRRFENEMFGAGGSGEYPSSPPATRNTHPVGSMPSDSKPTSSLPGNLDFSGAAKSAGAPELAPFLPGVVKAESGGDPTARATTSSAYGLGQFTAGTRQAIMDKYGVDAWSKDPNEQLKALAYLAKDNRDGLASSMGVTPDQVTPQHIYMANFLGQGGASTFLAGMQKDPNTPAIALVSPAAARANAGIFFKQDKTPRTAQEVFDLMGSKIGNVQLAQAGPQTVTDASAPPPSLGQAPTQRGNGGRLEQILTLPPEQFARYMMAAPKEYREPLMGLYKQKNPEAPNSLREFTAVYGRQPNSPEEYRQFKKGDSAGGSAFEGTGMDQQSWSIVNAIGPKIQDGTATPDEQRRYMSAEAHLTTPKVSTDPSTGAQTVMQLDLGQFGFPSLRKQAQQAQPPQQGGAIQQPPQTGYTTTQTGNRKPMAPGDAGKIQGANLSLSYLDEVENRLFPGGNYDRMAMMKSYLPGTDESDIRNKIREAIGYALYLKTGAAATPKEIAEQETLYTPGLADSPATARSKVDRLRAFLGSVVQGTGRGDKQQGASGGWDGQPSTQQPAPQVDLKSKYGLE